MLFNGFGRSTSLASVMFPVCEPWSVELVITLLVVASVGGTAVDELIVCEVVLGTAVEVASMATPLPVEADMTTSVVD